MQEKSFKTINIEKPDMTRGRVSLNEAWARVSETINQEESEKLKKQIIEVLKRKKAVLVAHYYVDGIIQDIAQETGGCVADSLEMARFGRDHDADTLVVAGVRFMGETAKMLSPNKRVIMPDLDANCSLDLGCPADEFNEFCNQHPDRTVVVYANTSAAVKARADWVVTSSVGLKIVQSLHQQGKKMIWAPDKHLGSYIQKQTGADMLLWRGSCVVHDEFKTIELELLKRTHPNALVLVHPESPEGIVKQADVVGSTAQLLKVVQTSTAQEFIVATEQGILHQMRKSEPNKTFFEAPTTGQSVSCQSCAYCPWMAMNNLKNLLNVLNTEENQIHLDSAISQRAVVGVNRMLAFAAQNL